jgi:transposase
LEAPAQLRRGQTTTFQERLDISERATAEQSDREIAAALGCSVWTVRTWRRRGQHQVRPGLGSQMGRPVTGPLGTLPADKREAILKMRQTHPGWGPTTLLAELRIDIPAGPISRCPVAPALPRGFVPST